MYFGLKLVVMVQVPLFDKCAPWRWRCSLFDTSFPEMYYTTTALLECLVLRERKNINSGILGSARHKLLRPKTVRRHGCGSTMRVLRRPHNGATQQKMRRRAS
jgi:hypothetical protein